MWPTLRSLWLSLSGKAQRQIRPHRGRTSRRPFLEVLEDRAVPAALSYSTYLGGTVYATTVDSAGNIYVTGSAYSTLATTPGALETTGAGAFVAKLNPAGTAVIYATESFVAKINPTLGGAASLVYSAYLGGRTGATGYVSSQSYTIDNPQTDGGIAVDSAGNAYVTSTSTATDFPATSGAFQTTSGLSPSKKTANNPPSDVFVTKLNSTGTALVYSTFLGGGKGTSRSGGAAITVDASGDAHVTGWTNSTAFPTKNPLQAANAGGYDAFVTVLNPSGSGLLFSTYFGGAGDDYGYGIALDSAGNAYVAGQTSSTNFPTTAGAY
jgi:hypothetical protein